MALAQGIEAQIVGILVLLAVGAWFWARRQLALWRGQAGATVAPQRPAPAAPPDTTTLPGAGAALARPPSDLAVTLAALERLDPQGRYRVPLGWSVAAGQARLSRARLVGDVNHTLVTGQSDSGKDVWALGALLCLCAQHPPAALQLCLIDGKGLDVAGFAGKAHTWRLALAPGEIAPTLRALSAERERRRARLLAAGVSKWDSYRGGDLPLLVVYVSELSLLQDAVGKTELESWLNTELAAGRAFGIRYVVATQTASNFSTRWRSQIGLFVAGYQVRDDQDEPNTGLTPRQIRQAGAVPPSALPAPPKGAGVFCVVAGREAVNVRAPLVDDGQRRAWLARLPDLPTVPAELVSRGPESPADGPVGEPARTGFASEGPGGEAVPTDTDAVEPEVEKIRKLAAQGWSRNQIASELGGNRQRTLDRIRQALAGTPWGMMWQYRPRSEYGERAASPIITSDPCEGAKLTDHVLNVSGLIPQDHPPPSIKHGDPWNISDRR